MPQLLLMILEFFKTGLFAVGGGLATIPFLTEMANKHPDWFTLEQLTDMIAVGESTPGPIGVNMATYAGYNAAGIPGAVCVTLALALPSFIIILLICAVIRNFLKYRGIKAFLMGVRPCVVALILGTAVTMALSTLLGFTTVWGGFSPDIRGIAILAILFFVAFVYKKAAKKRPSPILMILISACLGMLMYSF